MNKDNEMLCFNSIDSFDRLAESLYRSGLGALESKAQAFTLMAIAQSEGIHPARALMEYHIINGKPSLKADAMLARFQTKGGKVTWEKYEDHMVSAEFFHPSGGKLKISWDMKRAETAGLLQGKNAHTWKKYPRQMLKARVISEGIRAVLPSVITGLYTPEEIKDEESDVIFKKLNNKTELTNHIDAEDAEFQEIKENGNKNNHNFDIEKAKQNINACTDLDSLKRTFNGNCAIAKKEFNSSQEIINEMIAAKNSMKAKLTMMDEKNKSTAPIQDASNVYEMEKQPIVHVA